MRKSDIDRLNKLGMDRRPFVALISYDKSLAIIYPEDELADADIWFDSPLLTYSPGEDTIDHIELKILHSDQAKYQKSLKQAIRYIKDGHSYLLNFTDATLVHTDHSLEEIYLASRALFKVLLRDRFLSFSPERYIQIVDDSIHTFPMKGTIDATLPDAAERLLSDLKETTEHNTIVDLLRNDLSIIADDVTVVKYRYLTTIKSPDKNLLQASSHIQGQLSSDWHHSIGDMLDRILPAGSISGAPKQSTLEIIDELESQPRGFYTGVAVFYDGKSLDSCVLIRFMESTSQSHEYLYRSGGGITALSDPHQEYQETLQKIYVPFF